MLQESFMKILDLQDICINAIKDLDFSFNSLDLPKTSSDYFIFKSLNNFSNTFPKNLHYIHSVASFF